MWCLWGGRSILKRKSMNRPWRWKTAGDYPCDWKSPCSPSTHSPALQCLNSHEFWKSLPDHLVFNEGKPRGRQLLSFPVLGQFETMPKKSVGDCIEFSTSLPLSCECLKESVDQWSPVSTKSVKSGTTRVLLSTAEQRATSKCNVLKQPMIISRFCVLTGSLGWLFFGVSYVVADWWSWSWSCLKAQLG